MLDLFHPPKPPEIKPEDVALIHTLMDINQRYHDKGRRRTVHATLSAYLNAQRIRKRQSERLRRARRKAAK